MALLGILGGAFIAFAILDLTVGRSIRRRIDDRENRKRLERIMRRDLHGYEAVQARRWRRLDEPVDAMVIRHLRGRQ